jgi:hypothetical protein
MMIPSNWEEPTKVPLITSCKQVARLVSLSQERKLTFREFLAMRIHLMMCRTCTFYSRQTKALRRIFNRHEELLGNTPPSECECLDPKTSQKIKDLLSGKS